MTYMVSSVSPDLQMTRSFRRRKVMSKTLELVSELELAPNPPRI